MTRAISMENRGLVSVIIPNYNHGKYLEQRIESVLNQTYPHIELIILDDCSPDDSMSVIERYRHHSKISHIVRNEINVGSPFKQWAKGIELAKGEFVWIAESDDWCEPTMLNYLVEGMQQDDRCAISYCQSYCVIGNQIKWQSNHPKLMEVVESGRFIREYLCPNPAIFNASMAIWRRHKFNDISMDFLNYRFSGDWVFWIELAKTGNVCINGRLLNYFRKHESDVSTHAYASGLNFVEGLSILNRMFEAQLISQKEYNRAYKKNFKEFWPIEGIIDPAIRTQIMRLFESPLTSKVTFYKIWLSAIWASWKKK